MRWAIFTKGRTRVYLGQVETHEQAASLARATRCGLQSTTSREGSARKLAGMTAERLGAELIEGLPERGA